jgi:DNA-binding NarL/FixJ family response regulator
MTQIGSKAGYLPFVGFLGGPLDCIIAGLRSYDSLRIENTAKVASAVARRMLQLNHRGSRCYKGGMDVKTERILIVDNEPLTKVKMRTILEREGYRVFAAGSANEALRQAKKEDFALVLADIVKPCNGELELVEKLREVSPDTIPLLVRDRSDRETARAAMRMGVYDCLVEPVERSELCSAVAKALRRRWLINETLRRRRLIDEAQQRRQLVEGNSLRKRLVELVRNQKGPQHIAAG